MAIANHLTARDYFDQALVGRTVNRRTYISQSAGTFGSRTFQQLITSFGQQQSHHNGINPNGLTVKDYLSNPVRVKFQSSYRIQSASSHNKDAASAETPVPTTKIADGDIPDKSAEKSSLKIRPAAETIASASTPTQSGSNENDTIEESIHLASRKYNIPANLLRGVIRAESNFQATAVSRAGAQGLMQLMPATARELGVDNPFDIEQNIDGGARYLRKMLDSFGGDVKIALAAYNAGPGTVERYGGKIPPYQETERYIDRVLRFSKQSA
ncbi:Putative tail protein (ACLAME 1) [Olavius algarvensis Delta 1 endosymbiont]|nr:Putative tail protein (ACLAME 1) [Olavius algarvensis Delta 1 endosymbiont]